MSPSIPSSPSFSAACASSSIWEPERTFDRERRAALRVCAAAILLLTALLAPHAAAEMLSFRHFAFCVVEHLAFEKDDGIVVANRGFQ